MPTLNGQAVIVGATINPNVFAGSIWELPERNYYGRLALQGDAGFFLRATVQCGQATHLEESSIGGANRPPVLPDDIIIARFPIPRMRRLILKVRNSDIAANPHTIFWNLELTPA